MKRFIILMCFSFISEKQNNFWEREESSRHRLIPLSKLSGFSGNATCVLQYLICELAALTCPMLTPSLKLKTQTQWCMLQNLKSLRLWIQEWCPSLIVWKVPSVTGWKCKKKDSRETHSSLLFTLCKQQSSFLSSLSHIDQSTYHCLWCFSTLSIGIPLRCECRGFMKELKTKALCLADLSH